MTTSASTTKPAYFVAEVEIHDPAGFQAYAEQFAGTLTPFGGKLLSFGDSSFPLKASKRRRPGRPSWSFRRRRLGVIGSLLRFTEDRTHPPEIGAYPCLLRRRLPRFRLIAQPRGEL